MVCSQLVIMVIYKEILFDTPTVIVFSNHKVKTSKLSLDRWQAYTIDDDYELVSVSIDYISLPEEG